MRNRTGRRAARLILALAALSLGGCAELQKIRVAPLGTENSSSHRSMLADFDPLRFNHRSQSILLQAPEDRGGKLFWYHY